MFNKFTLIGTLMNPSNTMDDLGGKQTECYDQVLGQVKLTTLTSVEIK